MKNIINYLSVLTLILFLSNCDKSPTESTESTVDPLVGVWTWVSTNMTDGSTTISENSSDDENEIVIMNEDNTMSTTGKTSGVSFTGSGTWSKNGNYLTWNLTLSGESTVYTFILEYSISGNTFTGSKVDTIEGVEVTTTYTYTKG